MNKVTSIRKGIVLLVSLLAASITLAADLPRWYPESVSNLGIITAMSSDSISFGDERYVLARGVKVHTPSSRSASLSRIKVGDTIAFELRGKKQALSKTSKGTIKEIWLMPASSEPSFDVFL